MYMEWVNTEIKKPKFGVLCLVWCRIYGRYLATYEQIYDTGVGNWQDMNGNLGILPPIYWTYLPEPPQESKNY